MADSKLWTFAQWRKWAVGKHIDIDGWYGAQCWDAFADYAIRCAGAVGIEPWTSGNAGADSGLVSSIWLRFPAHASIDARFRQVSRHETPMEGDVAIWARSAAFRDSHIGMCTGRLRAGQIEVVSQNVRGSAAAAAGAVSVDWLTTGGLLGYLRPTNSSEGEEELTPEEKQMLADIHHTLTGGKSGEKSQGEVNRLLYETRKSADSARANSAAVVDAITEGKSGVRNAGLVVKMLAEIKAAVVALGKK